MYVCIYIDIYILERKSIRTTTRFLRVKKTTNGADCIPDQSTVLVCSYVSHCAAFVCVLLNYASYHIARYSLIVMALPQKRLILLPPLASCHIM